MPVILKHGMTLLLCSLILIVVSYFFVDKPLVFWAYHHHLRQYVVFGYLTKIAVVFAALPLLIYPYVIIRCAYRKFFMLERFLLVLASSIAISFFLKSILKLICSRYWPMPEVGNLSLIKDNVYGFNWFEFSVLNNSFPSGHATVIFSGLSVIGLFFRKTGWIIWPVALCVVLALVAEHYHFLSDILAGAALGYLVAYYASQMIKEKI